MALATLSRTERRKKLLMVGWLDGWAGGKDGSAGLGGIIVELVEIVLLVIVRLERFRCNCTTKLAGRSSSEVPEERLRLRLLGTAYCEHIFRLP